MPETGDETFAMCRNEISATRLIRCAELMGVALDGETLRLPFFNRIYLVSPNHMEDSKGNKPADALALVLYRYVLQYPSTPVADGRLITFRELRGAGPLVSSFTRNTNKLIAGTYGTDVETLIARSRQLNAERQTISEGHDVSLRFAALPGLPLFMHFNSADDLFAAQCSLLFYQSAERYLDMEGLFILGTYLAGCLVSPKADVHEP